MKVPANLLQPLSLSAYSRWAKPVVVTAAFAALALPCGANEWARVPGPSTGPARAIGETNSGCIAGASTLPVKGPGYVVMHLERKRNFGHPRLVDTIKSIGRDVLDRHLGLLQVGDLAQARGGPMPFGHRSHQTGLDVDVWFNLDPSLLADADPLRSNVPAPSLLNAARDGLRRNLWSDRQREVLETAARLPGVDRIFVNPHVKRELCRTTTGARDWLRRIRPWYHHDDHFHLRMSCPPDSPECEAQEPIPAGAGCDASLDWWFEIHLPEPSKTPPPPPKPRLPTECRALVADD